MELQAKFCSAQFTALSFLNSASVNLGLGGTCPQLPTMLPSMSVSVPVPIDEPMGGGEFRGQVFVLLTFSIVRGSNSAPQSLADRGPSE